MQGLHVDAVYQIVQHPPPSEGDFSDVGLTSFINDVMT